MARLYQMMRPNRSLQNFVKSLYIKTRNWLIYISIYVQLLT